MLSILVGAIPNLPLHVIKSNLELTIDLVVSGSHYETPMVSNGQQWAEPANRQRHNECELISVALTELIVMAH